MNYDTSQPALTSDRLMPLGLLGDDHCVESGEMMEFGFAEPPRPCRIVRIDIPAFIRFDFMVDQVVVDGVRQLPRPVLAQHFNDARWMPACRIGTRIRVTNRSGMRLEFVATLQVVARAARFAK